MAHRAMMAHELARSLHAPRMTAPTTSLYNLSVSATAKHAESPTASCASAQCRSSRPVHLLARPRAAREMERVTTLRGDGVAWFGRGKRINICPQAAVQLSISGRVGGAVSDNWGRMRGNNDGRWVVGGSKGTYQYSCIVVRYRVD